MEEGEEQEEEEEKDVGKSKGIEKVLGEGESQGDIRKID